MPSFLYQVAFLAPVTASASTAATNHPATNVLTTTRPRRTWRSTVATDGQYVDLDFGAAKMVDRIFVNNCNAGTIQIQASANGSSWTTVQAATAVPQDTRLRDGGGRYRGKGVFSVFSPAINHRYLRFLFGTVLAPSPGYFQLGAIVCMENTLISQAYFGAPEPWTPLEPRTELPYRSGGGEVNLEGPAYLGFRLVGTLAGGRWREEARPDVFTLKDVPIGSPIYFEENAGNPAHAYLLKRIQDISFAEYGGPRGFEAPLVFEECI